jgi:AcrR family transcriptional regulator
MAGAGTLRVCDLVITVGFLRLVSTIGRSSVERVRPVVLTCQAMVVPSADSAASGPRRRRRSDGERSRAAILREAARLATVEGLDGLSLGRLAEAVGMSKSGLFAHFGSKEELQLATIDAASAIFEELVIEPAGAAPAGLPRLRAYIEGFLDHVEESVFPGGCFFISAMSELDAHPGPVRDGAMAFSRLWLTLLAQQVTAAQAAGESDPDADPEQVAFELHAFMVLGNMQYVATREPGCLDRVRRAVDARLGGLATRVGATLDASVVAEGHRRR